MIWKKHNNDTMEIIDECYVFGSAEEPVELLMEHGCTALIVRKGNLPPAFFDLTSGVAGEMLQKFSTYHMRLAVVGDFSQVQGNALRDFIYESNRRRQILFVPTAKEAGSAFGFKLG